MCVHNCFCVVAAAEFQKQFQKEKKPSTKQVEVPYSLGRDKMLLRYSCSHHYILLRIYYYCFLTRQDISIL